MNANILSKRTAGTVKGRWHSMLKTRVGKGLFDDARSISRTDMLMEYPEMQSFLEDADNFDD